MTNTNPPRADQVAPERITVARRIGTGRRGVMGPERTMSMGYVDAVEYIRADLAAPSAPAERCENCDGTGDLIRQDGEWLGYCDCSAGAEWLVKRIDIDVMNGKIDYRLAGDIVRALTALQAENERLRGERDAWKANAEAFAKECEAIRGDCASWCSPAFAAYEKLKERKGAN